MTLSIRKSVLNGTRFYMIRWHFSSRAHGLHHSGSGRVVQPFEFSYGGRETPSWRIQDKSMFAEIRLYRSHILFKGINDKIWVSVSDIIIIVWYYLHIETTSSSAALREVFNLERQWRNEGCLARRLAMSVASQVLIVGFQCRLYPQRPVLGIEHEDKKSEVSFFHSSITTRKR